MGKSKGFVALPSVGLAMGQSLRWRECWRRDVSGPACSVLRGVCELRKAELLEGHFSLFMA